MQRDRTPQGRGFFSYVRTLGPGIVVALTWVGAGDLVQNIISGANYGYALIWALPVAAVFRFVLVSNIAKYTLFNVRGDHSIIRGFVRIHPGLGYVFGVGLLIFNYVVLAFLFSGLGSGLSAVTGTLDRFWWAVIAALSIVLVVGRGIYKVLEGVFKVILAAMVAAFLFAVAVVGIDWGALFSGLVGLHIPPQVGVFDSGLVLISLIASSVGSLANLVYPQMMAEKGWVEPQHRRRQQFDLLFATVIVAFLGLSVWIVGAQVMHGGPPASTEQYISQALSGAIGPAGTWLFYAGLVAVTWTTAAGVLFGINKLAIESFRMPRLAADEPFRAGSELGSDKLYKWFLVLGLSAIVWSLPFAPGFTWLTVVLLSFQAPMLVLTIVTVVLVLNKRSLMGSHRNRWWGNVTMAILLIFTLYAGYNGLSQAGELISQQFS